MTLESHLAAKIQWAWEDGCPVAGSSSDGWSEMAAMARRRWRSFDRRNKNKDDTRHNRVEDLARGLCEKYELGGLRMAGPFILNYRWLADQLASILTADSE